VVLSISNGGMSMRVDGSAVDLDGPRGSITDIPIAVDPEDDEIDVV